MEGRNRADGREGIEQMEGMEEMGAVERKMEGRKEVKEEDGL